MHIRNAKIPYCNPKLQQIHIFNGEKEILINLVLDYNL